MDRIGPHEFIRLDQPPDRVRRMWDVRAKTGIHGVAIWDLGERGEPFTVKSLQWFATLALARAQIVIYKDLEVLGPQSIMYGSFVELNCRVKVLRVRALACRAIIGRRGGVAQTYFGELEAEWTLLPINPSVSPP